MSDKLILRQMNILESNFRVPHIFDMESCTLTYKWLNEDAKEYYDYLAGIIRKIRYDEFIEYASRYKHWNNSRVLRDDYV